MRILVFGDAFFVPVINLTRFLVEAGHEVHLATIRPGPTPPEVARHEIRHSGRLSLLVGRGEARALAEAIKPDVVHAFYLTSYGYLASGITGVPVLVSATGTDVFGAPELASWLTPLRRHLGSVALRDSTHVHSVAEHMNDRLIAWGADPAKITTFPRGIDLASFRFVDRPAERPGPIRLLCNRKLEPIYDHATLIDGFALATRRGLDMSLRILGDGFLRSRIEARAHGLNVADRMQFDGAIPHQAVPEALRQTDLFISAARSDGTSSCLLEALAVGAIPIATDIPANRPWVRDGVTGFAFEAASAEALASTLERVLSSRSVWPAIRAAGRALVERAGDIEVGHRRTVAIYEQLRGNS